MMPRKLSARCMIKSTLEEEFRLNKLTDTLVEIEETEEETEEMIAEMTAEMIAENTAEMIGETAEEMTEEEDQVQQANVSAASRQAIGKHN